MAGIEPASSGLQPDARTNSATFPRRKRWESNPQGYYAHSFSRRTPSPIGLLFHKHLAERVGVEPTEGFKPRSFSKRLTLPVAISPSVSQVGFEPTTLKSNRFTDGFHFQTWILTLAVLTGVEPAKYRVESSVALPICLQHHKNLIWRRD
jgi:hypothetical protein